MVNGHVPIKKTIFSELGGFEKLFYYGGADRDFLFKCGLYNKNFRYIPNNILYYVRKREISTAKKRKENIVQREQIFFHLNNNYKQYLIDIKCYEMFIKKSLKEELKREKFRLRRTKSKQNHFIYRNTLYFNEYS